MDANDREEKPATWKEITDAVEKKNSTQLKECLKRYPGEHGNYDGLAALCKKNSKVSSELKVILMAKLVSSSLKDEYVDVLDKDFKSSNIKKVLEALLEQQVEKFDFTDFQDLVKKVTKDDSNKYKNIKHALEEFPTLYETSTTPTEYFVADACLRKCEIPSELKVILMAKLILRSQNEYYLQVLNNDFNRHDIKKVLRQLDTTTLEKLDNALKGAACNKVEAVLEKIMNKQPKAFSQAAAVAAIGTPVQAAAPKIPTSVVVKRDFARPPSSATGYRPLGKFL